MDQQGKFRVVGAHIPDGHVTNCRLKHLGPARNESKHIRGCVMVCKGLETFVFLSSH